MTRPQTSGQHRAEMARRRREGLRLIAEAERACIAALPADCDVAHATKVLRAHFNKARAAISGKPTLVVIENQNPEENE